MGPSGSGKSTLLRLVNHLEDVDDGEVLVDGRHVGYELKNGVLRPVSRLAQARAEARIGMVFQHFNLFDHLTVLDNISIAPVHVYGRDRDETASWRWRCCATSVSSSMSTICRIACPAGSSSGSRSRGPWPFSLS